MLVQLLIVLCCSFSFQINAASFAPDYNTDYGTDYDADYDADYGPDDTHYGTDYDADYDADYGTDDTHYGTDYDADYDADYGTDDTHYGTDYVADNDADYDTAQAYEEICEILQIDEAEHKLKEYGFQQSISFKELIHTVQNGNTNGVVGLFLSMLRDYMFGNINEFRTMMVEVISIVLLGSVFIHLSNSFGNGFVSENGFYVSYLIISSILLTAFSVTLQMVHQTLEQLIILIQIIAPVYAVAMQYLGHPLTATGMYELITIGIFIVQILILKIVLPMIQFYVITSMINHLNKEDMFSKLCKFVQYFVRWILKTLIVFVAGLNVIKSLIEPQMDALSKHAISKLIASVPGGGIVSVLTGTFFGAGAIIKNCIGVAGIILIVGLLFFPILKTFLMMLTARLTAVIIQPIGEKRFVDGVETLAEGMKLLLMALSCSIVLFVLTIAVMAYASKGG